MSARPRLTFVAALATLFAALSMSAAFDDGSWFWPVVATIAAAALGCALGRRIGLPRLVVPLLGVAAVVLVVTWLDARDVAVLGIIPGPGALRALDDLARQGFDGIRRYTTPAPTDPGLVLLTALGVGLVAVVVDTLAVGYRSAALAGAPLLTLYAVPLTVVRGGVPILLFVFAAVGWLALMLAEGRERLAGWGRALGRRSTKDNDPLTYTPPEPLGVVGRRIGAAAMGLALVVPVLMPWAGTSLFKGVGGGDGHGGGGGGGQVTQLSPSAQLTGWLQAKSEVTLIRYTTTDTSPEYLRVVTLDTFDGTGWKPAKQRPAGSARQMPPPVGQGLDGDDVESHIDIVGLTQEWLPVPYPGGSIQNLTGGWAYDGDTLDVFRTGTATTKDQQYVVLSRHIQPTVDELQNAPDPPADLLAHYATAPAGVAAQVRQLTQRLLAGKTTEYDKALALQQYFIDPKNGFSYTATPDLPGKDPLVAFLTKKQGFCQQYAAAYAVMARLAGLPTRIEIGFTPGTSPDQTGTRTITNRNAHAWPEVYFSGIGWVRFEPTASAPAGVAQPDYALGPNAGQKKPGEGSKGLGPDDRRNQDLNNNGPAGGNVPRDRTTGATPVTTSFPWALLLAVVAFVLMLLPGAARVVRRRRRLQPVPAGLSLDEARERVRVAWLEMAETSVDLHEPWPAARTPRRTADWIAVVAPSSDAAAAGYRLARAVERSRYAPTGVDVLGGTDPAADARLVCKALESSATRRERWRARFVPVSVLGRLSEWFADVLDWTDDAGARARGALRRRFTRSPAPADG